MDNLKPCPFCGKDAKLHRDSWPTNDKGGMAVAFWVKCAPCGSSSGEFKSKEKAIAAWNRRTAPATGQWIGEGDGYADGELVYDVWHCSECGNCIDDGTDDPTQLPKYCSNCGVKMTRERG